MDFGSRNDVYNQRLAHATAVDEGLRTFMLRVYNLMAFGLGLTGLVAYFVSSSPELMHTLFATPLKWVVMLAPLAVVFIFSAKISSMSPASARMVFWVYAALVGVSLSTIFVVFRMPSITRVFFITAALFGAMSLYGYTTKRSLASFGSFLFMGLLGMIIASLVNIFLQSSAMHFVISFVGVLVFTGLTAYDTQTIRNMYYQLSSEDDVQRYAVLGALNLYLDVINLFMSLLNLLGERK